MAAILAGAAVLVGVVIGVGAMLFHDAREHKRMMQNGGRRY